MISHRAAVPWSLQAMSECASSDQTHLKASCAELAVSAYRAMCSQTTPCRACHQISAMQSMLPWPEPWQRCILSL